VEGESHTTIDSMMLEPLEATNPDVVIEDVEALIDTNYVGKLKASVEAAIKAKWGKIMGPDVEIVVSYIIIFIFLHPPPFHTKYNTTTKLF
jgi:hypothetical protein